MTDPDLPPGWERWSSEPDGPIVLVYRPDVFDGADFPTECLPTIYISPRRDPRRAPPSRPHPARPWTVELRLEPAVVVTDRLTADREAAIDAAINLAAAFDAGEIEYRAAYQVPRDRYLEKLDELVGTDEPQGADESAEREA